MRRKENQTRSCCHTLCQIFERDIVEPVRLLHDQLLLVDLDDERGVAFVSSEPELANRVLEFLRDVYGVRLGNGLEREKMISGRGGNRRGGQTMVRPDEETVREWKR